jgi:hypothetical protein
MNVALKGLFSRQDVLLLDHSPHIEAIPSGPALPAASAADRLRHIADEAEETVEGGTQ